MAAAARDRPCVPSPEEVATVSADAVGRPFAIEFDVSVVGGEHRHRLAAGQAEWSLAA